MLVVIYDSLYYGGILACQGSEIFFCYDSQSSSIYCDWFAGTTGIVDYTNYDDMKYAVSHFFAYMVLFISKDIMDIFSQALLCFTSYKILRFLLQIKKLDGSEFRNAFSKSYVRVWPEFDCENLYFFNNACYYH